MPTVPAREAALAAIAARLAAALPDVPVERGRRSVVAEQECPRLVLRMGGHREDPADAFGAIRLDCEAAIEGYVAAPDGADDPDAALEAALNELHARCAAALLGVAIAYAEDDDLMVAGVSLEPDAPALDAASAAVGGFTWAIRFDLRVPAVGGPYVATAP
ncbi:hypothetical protein GCM10010964_43590 [Caldovatus sediminis]|uniref:Uncharacterized protein n=1 Tax=Caldovatus sediminis TaxID=2041189 RepID=A0A8J2ZFM4_9PROT|nr:hypothetical protein [Caldovatus sediminis]GGG51691.1 hypothetical protein GCM10010964_43590 [Caldovatus sediminis]